MGYRKERHEWAGVDASFWPRIARELPAAAKQPFLKAKRKGGRPRSDDRLAFGAILWRLRCGGGWRQLPARFGSEVTARRRLRRWLWGDRLERAWRAYLYQQSRRELERWRGCIAASAVRPAQFWRFGLDQIWKQEFEPLLPKKL